MQTNIYYKFNFKSSEISFQWFAPRKLQEKLIKLIRFFINFSQNAWSVSYKQVG